MTNRRKIIEWAKTALIIMLTVSMVVLGWHTQLFNDVAASVPFFGNFPGLGRTAPTAEPGETIVLEAARPLVIVITHEDGGRFGAKYDTDIRNEVYDWTSGIVGEALGSASAFEQICQYRWREALSAPGVFFEYFSPVWLSVINNWLGARLAYIEEDILLRRIFVAFGDESNRIYLQDIQTGYFYAAQTASFARKAPELEALRPNGARFAFEIGSAGAETAPYMLILPETKHPIVAADTAWSAEEILYIVRNAFGHGRETDRRYFDNDTLVSIGVNFNIRVQPCGTVLYRRTDRPPTADIIVSDSHAIEQARIAVSETIGGTSAGAEVFFEYLEHANGDNRLATFGYYIAGGRIRLIDDMPAARVLVSGGVVMEAELKFRSFSVISEEYTELLPEVIALAAAGGEFVLNFSDTGAEQITPIWVAFSS